MRLRQRLEALSDEVRCALLIAVAHGLIVTTLYVLKPVRTALFLQRVGIDELPLVLLLVAVAGAMSGVLSAALSRHLSVARLVAVTFAALGLGLVVFRLVLPLRWPWLFYAFYVFVNLYGALAVSAAWLVAGVAFDARAARRRFGLVGSGGIAGAIVGGLSTNVLAGLLGTENLVLIAAALLVPAGFLLVRVRLGPDVSRAATPTRTDGTVAPEDPTDPSRRLVRWIALLVGLAAVVATIIDVQFGASVAESFPGTDDKAAFLGRFFAVLSAAGFVIHLFLTRRVLGSYGLGAALLVLPIALVAGSAGILIVPGLLAATIARGADGALRHSLHKAATEVLLLPLSAAIKTRAKVLLDTTVDAAATGAGAGLVLLLTRSFGLGYPQLAWASIAFGAAWVVAALFVRRAYVDTFRRAIERRTVDPHALRAELSEAATVSALRGALDSQNEKQLVYALDALAAAHDETLVAPVAALLDHGSADVRIRALRVLHAQTADVSARVLPAITDASADVRCEAVRYLAFRDPVSRLDAFRRFLEHDDAGVRSATVRCIAEHGGAEDRALVDDDLVARLVTSDLSGEQDAASRGQVVLALSSLGGERFRAVVEKLRDDPSPTVVERVIRSIGEAHDDRFAPWLVEKLGDRRYRRAAREALRKLGDETIASLGEKLRSASPGVASPQIARVLAAVPRPLACEALLAALPGAPPRLRDALVEALDRLRETDPALRFDRAAVVDAIGDEARFHAELRLALGCAPELGTRGSAGALFVRAIAEQRQRTQARLFRLLGLLYVSRDMQNAHHGLGSDRPRLRANALELLDNTLSKDLKLLVLPMLEAQTEADQLREARRVAARDLTDARQVIGWALACHDPWLRACALHLVDDAWLDGAERAREDPDPVVREAAQHALSRLGALPPEPVVA